VVLQQLRDHDKITTAKLKKTEEANEELQNELRKMERLEGEIERLNRVIEDHGDVEALRSYNERMKTEVSDMNKESMENQKEIQGLKYMVDTIRKENQRIEKESEKMRDALDDKRDVVELQAENETLRNQLNDALALME